MNRDTGACCVPKQAAILTEEGLAAIRATAQLTHTRPRGTGLKEDARCMPSIVFLMVFCQTVEG